MHEHHWLRRHWKLVLNVVTIVALVGVVVVARHQVAQTFSDLGHVHAWALLLLIPVEVLNYHAQARLYQRLFAIVGAKVPYRFLVKASLELNFVNHVFPSGGVTGLSYFTLRLKDGERVSGAKATLIHLLKVVLYILSFELVLVFGVISLTVKSRVNNFVILLSGSLMTLLLVLTLAFILIVESRRRINDFFAAMTKVLNWVIHRFRPGHPETINIERARRVVDDFHNSYVLIKQERSRLWVPFWYALLADITEVAAVYVVYIAFGKLVNVGAVILAYAVANFAGLVSVLPGGVGIYEGLMTAVLAAAGISPALSLPVTVMYRVCNTVVQVPLGYYLYQRAIHRGEGPPVTPIAAAAGKRPLDDEA